MLLDRCSTWSKGRILYPESIYLREDDDDDEAADDAESEPGADGFSAVGAISCVSCAWLQSHCDCETLDVEFWPSAEPLL